jgi:hypothetical protein
MDEEPSARDWMMVGNDMRVVMNRFAENLGLEHLRVPLMTEPTRLPTEEELSEYDQIVPGLSDRIREMAREEMRHRKIIEEKINR